MKKLLINVIIFFLLSSNMAWAIDVADLVQEHEKQNHSSATSDDADPVNLNNSSSKHCCHDAVHFLGILNNSSEIIIRSALRTIATNNHARASQAYQPPLPPPNV
ncbi:MAG TPA: hypothetical protein ENH39_04115 [Gammaproteobacteria bacterium]|nr:hypothetical protein [Gammaproteobacteria bacterium]